MWRRYSRCIFGDSLAPRRLIFDPRAFAKFVVSNARKDSWDENASSLRHEDLFLGGPRLPPEVVSARLNFSARGPKNLLSHGKNQAGRALCYWSVCQNLGVSYQNECRVNAPLYDIIGGIILSWYFSVRTNFVLKIEVLIKLLNISVKFT